MQRFGLLLDVDGVIVQDRKLLLRVERNAARYVYRHVKTQDYVSLNKHLYHKYGHTLIGLQEEHKVKDSIYDFNNFVYDAYTINHLKSYLNSSDFQTIYDDIKTVLFECKNANVPVYLFSNAPLTWCRHVAYKLQISGFNVLSGYDLHMLKPIKAVYRKAHGHISMKEYSDKMTLMLVDDSPKNLAPISTRLDWIPIQFVNPSTEYVNDNIANVYNFKELRDYLTMNGIIGLSEFKDNKIYID